MVGHKRRRGHQMRSFIVLGQEKMMTWTKLGGKADRMC